MPEPTARSGRHHASGVSIRRHAGRLAAMTDVAARPKQDGPRPHKSEQDPASEEITEVAPGVLRMQLPIWMPGLGHVNMYGLVDERGIAVVDPGLPGAQSS